MGEKKQTYIKSGILHTETQSLARLAWLDKQTSGDSSDRGFNSI